MRAADVRAFVPMQTEPVKRVENRAFGCRRAAHAIGILDPQQELTAVPFGEAVVDQRDESRADVRIAGW